MHFPNITKARARGREELRKRSLLAESGLGDASAPAAAPDTSIVVFGSLARIDLQVWAFPRIEPQRGRASCAPSVSPLEASRLATLALRSNRCDAPMPRRWSFPRFANRSLGRSCDRSATWRYHSSGTSPCMRPRRLRISTREVWLSALNPRSMPNIPSLITPM